MMNEIVRVRVRVGSMFRVRDRVRVRLGSGLGTINYSALSIGSTLTVSPTLTLIHYLPVTPRSTTSKPDPNPLPSSDPQIHHQ